MPEEARQNCCRLCLAPDSECISILNSYAADKEPLTTKIQNCVHIKVTSSDGLSLRICHACISYLNSWQSFKNRCVAAQVKQRNWAEFGKRQQLTDKNVSISTISGAAQRLHQQRHHQQDHHQFSQESNMASSILDGITSLKKRKSLTVYPLPAIQVKDEPIDEEEYESMKHQHDESDEMVDPTLFLERNEEEGGEPYMTHVHSSIQDVSNYNYEQPRSVPDRTTIEVAATAEVKEASCRACHLKFSTRANARRHERNLHPDLFELSTSTPNSTPVTKPTAALAAALELQRAAVVAGDMAKKSFAALNVTSGAMSQRQKLDTNFDYENPERYQDLLTDEKIVFLQQNEEFLQQYQTMTCKCCRKFYTSYKNFMAHMRKKYVTLPRNVCFNCLKLNDSKALFISHLKKRNCVNLYKIMHSLIARVPSFAAAVAATTAAMPEKMRAKELLVNKIYECKLCTKHFRLKLEFRTHVYDEHADAQKKEVSPGQCGFCGLEIEDALERKRHYNNMDCIVILRCVTCDEKFGNHQKFLDHVYAKHLVQTATSSLAEHQHQRQPQQTSSHPHLGSTDNSPGKKTNTGGFAGATSSADESRGSSVQQQHAAAKSQYFSRMPQACPICGQQYNNYNNVLRHMESKHPDQLPQTYKCVKCGNGYPRLSNLREHMLTAHSGVANNEKTRTTSFEYIVNADAVKAMESGGGGGAGGSGSGAYSGRYDYVMKDLMSITNGGTVADDDDDEDADNVQMVKRIRLDTRPNSNAAATSGNSNTLTNYKECPICSAIFSNNIGLSNHMRTHTSGAHNFSGVASSFRDQSAKIAAEKPTSAGALVSTAAGSSLSLQQKTSAQLFKRSLELAADRRFRRMRCRICQKRFSSKKSYRRHMLDDHQIRNVQFIKCKLCDAEFAYEKGLKVHMFKIHNTLLKDEMIIKQYECDICSIVYRTEDQLLQHKKSVHGNEHAHPDDFVDKGNNAIGGGGGVGGSGSGIRGHSASTDVSINMSSTSQLDSTVAPPAPLYWYQCKYCPSNFNTNKKLAIHINSHDEFDSNDYSCKDCGNVYSGRKSLWVHRYKKHPQIAEPSECVLCRKVFFDSQMLENHIPTCNRKPITATGAIAEQSTSGNNFYRHKTGDDEDDDGSHGGADAADDQGSNAAVGGDVEQTSSSKLKIKLPEVACTICGQRFTDQDLFAKHIQIHEMELYTDNPLAAMFDTGPADPNQFYLDRVNDNGEYACDICTKAFTQMTALKVHRKWHFRGDSKQNLSDGDPSVFVTSQTPSLLHPPGLQAVGLMPNPRPSKPMKRKRELKCEYCPSTFISNNNLRRHIYELHKSEIAHWPEPPKIKLDDHLHCRKCAIKFASKKDWIDHKVADARLMKPYGPFQWGCELCGEYVSRKEKLIHHIQSHMKENIVVPVHQRRQQEAAAAAAEAKNDKNATETENYGGGESNSQDSQQSEENGGDYDVDVTTKDNDSGEDDCAVDYEVDDDEEQEQEEEEDDDDDEEDDIDDGEGGDANDNEAMIKNERSLQQIESHEEEANDDDDENIENMDDNANDGQHANDEDLDDDVDDEEEEDDDDDVEDDDDDEDTNEYAKRKQTQDESENFVNASEAEDSLQFGNDVGDDVEEDDDDDEDEDDDGEGEEENCRIVDRDHDYADIDVDNDENDDVNGDEAEPERKARFACDLCQVYFDTQLELQKHVKIHFLNGPGSVTLTDIRAKQVNKSRSSRNSDVVTVSSS